MKMLKTLVAASVLSAMAAPVMADTTVYGKVNVTVQSSDDGSESITELKSNNSRLGVKGSQKLDGGLEVVYKYELQVDVSDESGEKNLKSRNQYVGLKGAFGEVLIGRNDTMFKQSQGKFDLFSDLEGDIKVLWKGENRMSDSISYKTPSINGFQGGISYILDEDADDAATSLSLTYGDGALKKGKYYAAIAIDSEVKGYDATRLTLGTKVSDVKLGFMFQTQENVESGEEKDGFLVSAQYKLGKYDLKGQYQSLEDDNGFTIGADRKLGKNTKVFGFYTTYNMDMSEDENYLALGLEHKF
ncbi:porin [Psychrosphaera ytuae]|uniref:Porin n=1 Tax=Psychrosphaera ytuae TaxID=2820710 RepID=A0A975DDH0_9GAMM|nr:porin [Psychrosphaera ytuae]QTH65147.1 porin [Psychrosphaera ytuae]